jgi:formylglycine-generating enzyme required for sulfatase activity
VQQLLIVSVAMALASWPLLADNRAAEGTDTVIVNFIDMRLVLVPAGAFIMGSPKDEPDRGDDELEHRVKITRPYYMGAHLVTQAEYARVMGRNPSWFSRSGAARQKVQGLDTNAFPVESVSRRDAQQFCERLSELDRKTGTAREYRLPTEAEWEFACREAGASTTRFHVGNTLSSTQSNFDGAFPYGEAPRGPSLSRTSRVGSYAPNRLGLHDMHGNVWQWCSDWYDRDYYGRSPDADPQGPDRGRTAVIRGGAWCQSAKECRSAYRGNEEPSFQDGTIGFRVVCVLP